MTLSISIYTQYAICNSSLENFGAVNTNKCEGGFDDNV
jgi:hypothetical protein